VNIKAALFAHLKDHAGLAALISGRIYPLQLPQEEALPAVTYFIVSDVPERDLSGVVRRRARSQLTCLGRSYKEVEQVAAQVRLSLQDFTGVMGGAGGPDIMDLQVFDQADGSDSQVGVYQLPVDALILYRGGF
jgi:hypothetical protein